MEFVTVPWLLAAETAFGATMPIGGLAMLTYEDCVGMSELTADEVDAIAEHEHVPAIVAVEMGRYLMTTPTGSMALRRMILDDIEAARHRGDTLHAACLRLVLRDFCQRCEIKTD